MAKPSKAAVAKAKAQAVKAQTQAKAQAAKAQAKAQAAQAQALKAKAQGEAQIAKAKAQGEAQIAKAKTIAPKTSIDAYAGTPFPPQLASGGGMNAAMAASIKANPSNYLG